MAPLLGLYIRWPFSYKGDLVSRKRVSSVSQTMRIDNGALVLWFGF